MDNFDSFFVYLQAMSPITKTDEKILTTLTYVGLTLSIIGIILTIISYALFT